MISALAHDLVGADRLSDPADVFEPESLAARFVERRTAPTTAKPVHAPVNVEPCDSTLIGITDAILKSPESLDRRIAESTSSATLIMKLLAVSLFGFVLFGFAMSLVFSSAKMWPQLQPLKVALVKDLSSAMSFTDLPATTSILEPWLNGRAFKLTLAYTIGLIGATGVCLPSLYFYGLLAGVRMTMLDVVMHALKAKATAAIALIGILPVYAAFALGVILFDCAPATRELVFHLGLALPFIAGVAGCQSLYRGFGNLPCDLSPTLQYQRQCFLRRLLMSWSLIFTAVSPVMIHELWASF